MYNIDNMCHIILWLCVYVLLRTRRGDAGGIASRRGSRQAGHHSQSRRSNIYKCETIFSSHTCGIKTTYVQQNNFQVCLWWQQQVSQNIIFSIS